ncbi:hypothetical protein F4680DRAFT_465204 [Xylaria scruposa]|nr:hypothetical protein F4680DRAFT_465204 [Xylaria scruposa]
MADVKDEQPQMVDVNDQDGYAQLKSRVDELEKGLQKKTTETDKALAQLRTELDTKRRFIIIEALANNDFDTNAISSNFDAEKDDFILRPLKNIETGETVFLPPTLRDFLALTEREVQQLLRGLGLEPKGIAVEDLDQLASYIGISPSIMRTMYGS